METPKHKQVKYKLHTPNGVNRNRDLDFAENEVEKKIRAKSPYINGKRNNSFIAPHFKSQILIGDSNENDIKGEVYLRKNPLTKMTKPNPNKNNNQLNTQTSFIEENKNLSKLSDYNSNIEEKNQANPFDNNQYNKAQEEAKRVNTNNNSFQEKAVTDKSKNDSLASGRGGLVNNYNLLYKYKNPVKNSLTKPKQLEFTMKEESTQMNEINTDKKPSPIEKISAIKENQSELDNFNSKRNTNPSSNSEKNEEDQLICDLCFNKDLINDKNSSKMKEKENPQQTGLSSDFNEKLKSDHQSKINNLIKHREKMSELISNTFLQKVEKPKEKLIEKNLMEKSFISELGLNNDPIYIKAKNNYLEKQFLQQNFLNKNVCNEKPVVKEYYNRYVDNYVTIENKDENIDKFSNLKNDLLFQIESKQMEKERKKLSEKNYYTELNMKNRQIDEEENQKKLQLTKRKKEELYIQNKSAEEEKKRNKEKNLQLEKQTDIQNLMKLNDNFSKEEENIRIKKDEVLNQIKEDLLKQIEKKKLIKEEQANLNKTSMIEPNNNFNCQHGSTMKPCDLCKKKFPVKMLSKRAHSLNHLGKKKQFKV